MILHKSKFHKRKQEYAIIYKLKPLSAEICASFTLDVVTFLPEKKTLLQKQCKERAALCKAFKDMKADVNISLSLLKMYVNTFRLTAIIGIKISAPGEARTHGLQIMRLTRCLLRYGGI